MDMLLPLIQSDPVLAQLITSSPSSEQQLLTEELQNEVIETVTIRFFEEFPEATRNELISALRAHDTEQANLLLSQHLPDYREKLTALVTEEISRLGSDLQKDGK